MSIEVIDNCLSQEDFTKIKSILLSTGFPWYYNDFKVAATNTLNNDEKYDFQFTHVFYKNFAPQSTHIELLEPVLKVLNPCAIHRIKANITTISNQIIKYPFHIDEENFVGKTAIFYVNSNNGYTEFDSGEKIDSVENRLVVFDSTVKHRGTSATDSKVRCVLNFNYFPWA